jgi:hypothetical protein
MNWDKETFIFISSSRLDAAGSAVLVQSASSMNTALLLDFVGSAMV